MALGSLPRTLVVERFVSSMEPDRSQLLVVVQSVCQLARIFLVALRRLHARRVGGGVEGVHVGPQQRVAPLGLRGKVHAGVDAQATSATNQSGGAWYVNGMLLGHGSNTGDSGSIERQPAACGRLRTTYSSTYSTRELGMLLGHDSNTGHSGSLEAQPAACGRRAYQLQRELKHVMRNQLKQLRKSRHRNEVTSTSRNPIARNGK